MELFSWEERFAIGIPQIDDHHRHLVGLLNKAYDDFLHHAPQAELDALFNDLIDYATYHFAAEEHRMETSRYPGMAAHKRQHGEFIRRVVEMHKDLQKQQLYFLEALGFLKEWLTDHILRTDIELGRYLTAAACKTAA